MGCRRPYYPRQAILLWRTGIQAEQHRRLCIGNDGPNDGGAWGKFQRCQYRVNTHSTQTSCQRAPGLHHHSQCIEFRLPDYRWTGNRQSLFDDDARGFGFYQYTDFRQRYISAQQSQQLAGRHYPHRLSSQAPTRSVYPLSA